ncbi:MAG TPA: bifunctional phosphoglucose/phosphomannose isomerase [Fimbriimonadaceae bacterium]|nr:bifunctional phosphoglucose/phosphomannose isomerase [Fimbriimonadaceae bacterium]
MSSRLDDRAFVTRLDPKGMLRLTEEFPAQCRKAYEIAQAAELPSLEARPSLVVLAGIGGSAAGGDFARAIFEQSGVSPFLVNRDYHLPHFVGLGDLVFATSYSGNTEETLSAYADAKKAGARIICVTSGGKLAELARADGNALILIPGGQPPRTAMGYMLIPVLVAAQRLKLIAEQDYEGTFTLLERKAAEWTVEGSDSQRPKELAQALHGNLAVIYGLGSWQGVVATRWKGQINENSKNHAFPNVFPELNHNEVLGWVKAGEQGVAKWVAVILEDGSETAKMKARSAITERLAGSVAEFHHVVAEGDSLLAKMLGLAFFGDFVSIYLAALNGVDPENMDWLIRMKEELAEIK